MTSAVMAQIEEWDETGTFLGMQNLFLPEYLDWMPIAAKMFWFTTLGRGDPLTKYALFRSQGEQRLYVIDQPLRPLTYQEYKEISSGLESTVQSWIDEQGISRTPRNQ